MEYRARALAVLNKLSLNLLTVFAVAVLLLFTTAKVGLAAGPNLSVDANTYKQQHPHFFPFHDCIVMTIKSVHHVQEGNGICLFVNANVNKVIRGNCKKGVATFAIRGGSEELKETREKLERLSGQQAVLSFSPYPAQLLNGERDTFFPSHPKVDPWFHDPSAKRAIWIHKIYMPLSGRNLSAIDISKAIGSNEPKPYPYSTCILVSIVAVDEMAEDGAIEITGKIENVLLGAPSRKGKLISFLVPQRLLPKKPKANLIGCKCIWEFCGGYPETVDLRNGHCPFPGQVFSSSDLARFKAKLSSEKIKVEQRKASLVKCLQQRWTQARLKDFCRPETRYFVLNTRLRPFDGSDVWSGSLYPPLELSTGKAQVDWNVEIIDGVPEVCEIYVGYEKPIGTSWHAWQPEFGWLYDLYSENWNDDDYVKFRTTTMIESLVDAYLRMHKLKWSSEFGTQWANRHMAQTKLIHGGDTVIGYSCPLADGQMLNATLDKQGKITGILLNGKNNQIWTKALTEANKNLDIENSVKFLTAGKRQ